MLSLIPFHLFIFAAFVFSGNSRCPRMSDVFVMCLRENFWVVECVHPHPKVEPIYKNEYLLPAYVAREPIMHATMHVTAEHRR